MRRLCTVLALGAALLAPTAIHAEKKRVVMYYDSGARDRHEWNEREERAYRHWREQERRQAYRDWKHTSKRDQREYWRWRHANPNWQ